MREHTSMVVTANRFFWLKKRGVGHGPTPL